jgi:hypothetical protein
MKRRTGFVSNSSSSSFIIGIGIIKDEDKLRKALEAHGCSEYDYEIKTLDEIKESDGWDNKYRKDTSEVVNTACINDEPEITLIVKDTSSKVLLVNVGNNEGDDSFWNGDDMDYDQVDYDWFSKDQQFLMDVLENNELISGSSGYEYGASRNG